MLSAMSIGFKTSIWYCVLTHISFWLNNGKYAGSNIIKLQSLSSTRMWWWTRGYTIFFIWACLISAASKQCHGSQLSTYNEPKSRVYMYTKETSKNFSRPSNPSSCIFHICILPIILYKLALPKCSISCQRLL